MYGCGSVDGHWAGVAPIHYRPIVAFSYQIQIQSDELNWKHPRKCSKDGSEYYVFSATSIAQITSSLSQRQNFIVAKLQSSPKCVFGRVNMSSAADVSTESISENGCEHSVQEPVSIAVCQMTSTSSKEENLKTIAELISSAKSKGAQMVFLPEACDYIGETKQQAVDLAESLDGNFITRCRQLAESHRVWLSVGGFHQKTSQEGKDKTLNTHVLIDSQGQLKATYAKTHLFDLDLPGKARLMESDYTVPGGTISPPVQTVAGAVGMAICYDVRFPELSLALAQGGANILTFPSAFTKVTGEAHWETLLRSRAIETQCYVVAAAQAGDHNAKRSSHGHAMIVDPWGTIVAHCGESETGISIATVDLAKQAKLRRDMPVWKHRRRDLYGQIRAVESANGAHPDNSAQYQFGHVTVTSDQVFYRTALSFAFVNIKPVLPGHMLIAPLRPAVHLSDLEPAEVSDLFLTAQRVSSEVNKHFSAASATIAVQDGPDAGQTVQHVHVHVIPRKPGDFAKNDDVYDRLQGHDQGWTENTVFRTEAQMAEEASQMRTYFYSK